MFCEMHVEYEQATQWGSETTSDNLQIFKLLWTGLSIMMTTFHKPKI
jgi:hypothetical protein